MNSRSFSRFSLPHNPLITTMVHLPLFLSSSLRSPDQPLHSATWFFKHLLLHTILFSVLFPVPLPVLSCFRLTISNCMYKDKILTSSHIHCHKSHNASVCHSSLWPPCALYFSISQAKLSSCSSLFPSPYYTRAGPPLDQ